MLVSAVFGLAWFIYLRNSIDDGDISKKDSPTSGRVLDVLYAFFCSGFAVAYFSAMLSYGKIEQDPKKDDVSERIIMAKRMLTMLRFLLSLLWFPIFMTRSNPEISLVLGFTVCMGIAVLSIIYQIHNIAFVQIDVKDRGEEGEGCMKWIKMLMNVLMMIYERIPLAKFAIILGYFFLSFYFWVSLDNHNNIKYSNPNSADFSSMYIASNVPTDLAFNWAYSGFAFLIAGSLGNLVIVMTNTSNRAVPYTFTSGAQTVTYKMADIGASSQKQSSVLQPLKGHGRV